jgi:two-component system, OmpR family, sensor histidine kinase KdpD
MHAQDLPAAGRKLRHAATFVCVAGVVLAVALIDDRRISAAVVAVVGCAMATVALIVERRMRASIRGTAERLGTSLLASVSHDLRTPIAVITGNASTLLDPRLDPDVRTDLTETIVAEAERLHRLVRNLLDMTRVEAGVAPKKEWQALEEAVGAAIERVSFVVGDRPITTALEPDLPLVPYDPVLLEQVLVNLLENAAKFTPDRTPIEIAARRIGGTVEVVVSDDGPGLPRGDEAKVFDRFYRAEKGRGGGFGLGLTICKGIVTAHGGKIWADRRGGAAFHLTLPIVGTPPPIGSEGG